MHCRPYSPSLWLILPLVQICMNECQCVFCPEHFLLASVQPCWHLLQIIAKYSWFNSCSGPTSEGDVYNKSRQDELITNTNQIVFAHIMDKPHSTLKKKNVMVVFLHAAARSHSSRTYWLLYSFSFPFFLHLLKVPKASAHKQDWILSPFLSGKMGH